MKIKMVMKWDGITPEMYEKIRKLTDWEGNKPKGAMFHAASFAEGGLRVTDIWESADDFNSFASNRLMPVIAQVEGVTGEPQVEISQLHAIYVPSDVKLN